MICSPGIEDGVSVVSKKLSVTEAACIVAGSGIGSGLMALPFLARNTGWLGTALILGFAALVTVILHLMAADTLLTTENGSDLVAIFHEFLFRGKWQRPLTAGFFLLLLVALLFNLSAYVAGGADIIMSIPGMSASFSKLLFYGVAIIVPLLGYRALGISEKMMVTIMAAATVVLGAISFARGGNTMAVMPAAGEEILALYGLAMFSFNALILIPRVVEGLERDLKAIRKAVVSGVSINLGMSFLICLAAVYASDTVTEVAIVGWGAALGMPVRVISSLLILAAMLTSFWAVATALSDMVYEQLHLKKGWQLVFIGTTLPCFLLSFLSDASFTSFVAVAGGRLPLFLRCCCCRRILHQAGLPGAKCDLPCWAVPGGIYGL